MTNVLVLALDLITLLFMGKYYKYLKQHSENQHSNLCNFKYYNDVDIKEKKISVMEKYKETMVVQYHADIPPKAKRSVFMDENDVETKNALEYRYDIGCYDIDCESIVTTWDLYAKNITSREVPTHVHRREECRAGIKVDDVNQRIKDCINARKCITKVSKIN